MSSRHVVTDQSSRPRDAPMASSRAHLRGQRWRRLISDLGALKRSQSSQLTRNCLTEVIDPPMTLPYADRDGEVHIIW